MTEAGTEVFEPSTEEYANYLEAQAEELCGMSVDEFQQRFEAGQLDEGDPAVSELAGLLRIGQSGRL